MTAVLFVTTKDRNQRPFISPVRHWGWMTIPVWLGGSFLAGKVLLIFWGEHITCFYFSKERIMFSVSESLWFSYQWELGIITLIWFIIGKMMVFTYCFLTLPRTALVGGRRKRTCKPSKLKCVVYSCGPGGQQAGFLPQHPLWPLLYFTCMYRGCEPSKSSAV